VRGRSGLAVGEVRPSGGWPGLDAIAAGEGRPRGVALAAGRSKPRGSTPA
jgi:hypothetical protein